MVNFIASDAQRVYALTTFAPLSPNFYVFPVKQIARSQKLFFPLPQNCYFHRQLSGSNDFCIYVELIIKFCRYFCYHKLFINVPDSRDVHRHTSLTFQSITRNLIHRLNTENNGAIFLSLTVRRVEFDYRTAGEISFDKGIVFKRYSGR